jgi:hypothetical protein
VILYIAYRRKSARKHLENQEIELSNPLREGPNAWNDDERGAKIYSKPVKTTDFLDYVKSSWKNGDLVRQHEVKSRGFEVLKLNGFCIFRKSSTRVAPTKPSPKIFGWTILTQSLWTVSK